MPELWLAAQVGSPLLVYLSAMICDSDHRPVRQKSYTKGSVLCFERSARCEQAMAKRKAHSEMAGDEVPISLLERLPLWQLDIVELTGHNLETRGREEVNRLLDAGWRLLHIYTLKYQEDGVWRERPMGILGRLRNGRKQGDVENVPPLKRSSEL
jgi:hypothetical protein